MTNQVVVSNIPWSLNSQKLAQWCRTQAPVTAAEIFVDPITGRSTGRGLVTFESVTDAKRAVEQLSGTSIGTNQVTLTIAGSPSATGGA